MGVSDRKKTVDDLFELWAQLSVTRAALKKRSDAMESLARDSGKDVAALRRAGTPEAAEAADQLAALMERELVAARAARDEFEGRLAGLLGRVSPPWDLPARFSNPQIPGLPLERRRALLQAIVAVLPLAEERLARERPSTRTAASPTAVVRWRPDGSDPKLVEDWRKHEADVAVVTLLAARAVQSRFDGSTPKELGRTTAATLMDGALNSDEVKKIIAREMCGVRTSVRAVAEEVVGQFIGLSSSAVRKATAPEKPRK